MLIMLNSSQNDYYATYTSLCNFLIKDASWIIITFSYVKCYDCNDMYHSTYFTCECGKNRCTNHTTLKTIIHNGKIMCNNCKTLNPFINSMSKSLCIVCKKKEAAFGYKDIVCYCYDHTVFRKTKTYTYMCGTGCVNLTSLLTSCGDRNCRNKNIDDIKLMRYDDLSASLPDKNGTECSLCKKKFLNVKNCQCSSYCYYCFAMCTWTNEMNIVCQKCQTGKYPQSLSILRMSVVCHYKNCMNRAEYSRYGILLFCSNHMGKNDVCMNNDCKIKNCYRKCVYQNFCYVHVSKKIRKKLDYFIK